MKDIKDYEVEMVHNGKRNIKYALVKCSYCGEDKWEQWQRIKRQENFFCTREHCNLWQRKWGKEHAYFYYDKLKMRWMARWRDKENGETRVQHRSKFFWEQEYGEVSDGYDIHHIDGDTNNDDLDNLEMVEGILHKQGIHGSNRVVIDGVVHRQCYKCFLYYPTDDFRGQTYCTSCRREYMRDYRKKN